MAEKKSKKIKAEEKPEEEQAKPAPGKLNIYDLEGKVAGHADLPASFKVEFRPDVIRRAVNSI